MNNSGVQVERTGGDQWEAGFIHAEDAREYLLTLGVSEQQIAIKTSEKNDLKEPENLDLLSPTNQIRFIITRQALQEGWDCPFAYVFCFHATTRDVVDAIKKGLEQDGMSDLADRIRDGGGGGNGDNAPRLLTRRGPYRRLKIYLPIVNRVEGDSVWPLDYERDILYRIDWDQVNLNGLASLIPEIAQDHEIQIVQVGLALPFTHKSCHSESSGGHMQGALSKQWLYPLQEGGTQQMAAGWLARREPLHTGHTCVAALANGITIICAPRLGLTRVQGLCGMICG